MKSYDELTLRGQVRRIRPQALDLLKQHGIEADRLVFINHGENTTFRAYRGADSYLCRIHRPGYQDEKTIRSEMTLIEHLRARGLNVPNPVFKAGEAVLKVDAPRIEPRDAVLFRWIPGRFQSSLGASSGARLGHFMATLHNAVDDFRPGPDFHRNAWDSEGLAHHRFAMDRMNADDRAVFERVQLLVEDACSEIGQSSDVYGMVHSDLHFQNRLVQDGELWAIDFDDCGDGWFLYDIAIALAFHQRAESFDVVWSSFLKAYRQERDLSDRHAACLELFIAARRMHVCLWILARRDNPRFVEIAPEVTRVTVERLSAFLDTV